MERGFVRVRCTACDGDDAWLQCNACQRRADFVLGDDRFDCSCGANYDHAACLCGAPVPIANLTWVEFGDGPVSLSDLEPDWTRIGIAGIAVASAVAAMVWLATGS